MRNTENPSDADVFDLQARFCGIFSNPARLRIMDLLGDRELCVSDIACKLDLPLPTVSQHLQTMKDRCAVRQRREGQNVFYQVTNPTFLQASALIRAGLLEETSQGIPRTQEDMPRSTPRRRERGSDSKEKESWTRQNLPT